MKRGKLNFLNKEVAIIALVLIIYAFSLIIFSPLNFVSSDMFKHQATILRMADKSFSPHSDTYFTENVSNPSYSPYFEALSVVYTFTSNFKELYLVIGLINLFLLLFSTYYFINYFFKNKQLANFASVLVILLWGASKVYFAGLFFLSDLIFTATYPSVFSFSLALLSIIFLDKYFTYLKKKYLIISAIFGFIIITSHPFTGVIFGLMLLFLFINNFKKLSNLNKIVFFLFPIILFLSYSIWFETNLFELVKNLDMIHISDLASDLPNFQFGISNWILIGGPFFIIGLLGIKNSVNEKNRFLIPFMGVLFIVSITYLSPIRPSYFWRFLLILIFFMNLFFVNFLLNIKPQMYKILILFLIILISMLMFSEKLYLVDQSYGKDYYKVYDSFPLNFTSHNDIILSDPMTSYHLAGIYGFHVYGVLLEHMNQANEKIATDRYYKLSSLFITQNLTIQDLIKENPKENYVLVINKRYIGYGTLFPSNISFEYIKNMTNGYETIENDNFILKKLKIINSS